MGGRSTWVVRVGGVRGIVGCVVVSVVWLINLWVVFLQVLVVVVENCKH